MAKRSKRTSEPKPAASPSQDKFVELMLVAAEFVRSCGGMEQAKKGLADAGQFIERAGSIASANKALDVLENLKSKIGD